MATRWSAVLPSGSFRAPMRVLPITCKKKKKGGVGTVWYTGGIVRRRWWCACVVGRWSAAPRPCAAKWNSGRTKTLREPPADVTNIPFRISRRRISRISDERVHGFADRGGGEQVSTRITVLGERRERFRKTRMTLGDGS